MNIRTRSVRAAAVAGALVALVAACGGDDDAATTTAGLDTTTTALATTAAPETTTTAAATTTTAPETTTTAAATTTSVTDTNSLAEGSGCTPGTDDLPDGDWYGLVDEAAADELVFDLACWFTGETAAHAAAEDGEESPPPNDYYVRNENEQLRTVAVSADAEVTWLPNPGDPSTTETVPYADWLTARAERDFHPGVWLTVEDGAIVVIAEQYVP